MSPASVTKARRAVVILAVALTSCSTFQYSAVGNKAKPRAVNNTLYNTSQPHVSPQGRTIVGLAVSGGGSRAAYLTAAILREIHRSDIRISTYADDPKGDLLGQLDFVSAVSGGSLSATYFALNADALQKSGHDSEPWHRYMDKISINFRTRQWYAHGLLNPITWAKTVFGNYNRGNLAREDYDATLYGGATLDDLPARPVVYVNAFDVANRVRFIFSKHYIHNEVYDRGFADTQRHHQDLLAQNDLSWCRIDPASVKVADAVYASSAYPIAYPHLPLNHFGTKIPWEGSYIFLADGGLADNSGLLTLSTQIKKALATSPDSRYVLMIFIDASLATFQTGAGHGTKYQTDRSEQQHAWRNTYLGHGIDSIEAAIDAHEDVVMNYLGGAGVLMDDLPANYANELPRKPAGEGPFPKNSWANELRSGQLLLRPNVIALRLRDLFQAYYPVWLQYSDDRSRQDPELARLFKKANIEELKSDAIAATEPNLYGRVAGIQTDFALREEDKTLLDLVAYLLVHGKLEPALAEWDKVVGAREKDAMRAR